MTSPVAPLSAYQAAHFLWQVEDRVGSILLNRPERKNPLTFESYAELRDLFRALVYDREIRAIVITGAGGNFCSGGDVHEIIGAAHEMKMPQLLEFTRMTGDLVKAMRACPQPIIAAVDGVCAGAGAITRHGFRSAARHAAARTAFLFTRVGLAGCDMGACAMLPRIIGQGRAAELLFTGRAMTADEGLALGIFQSSSFRAEQLAERNVWRWRATLATGPTFAHAMTKNMLHQEWNMSIDEALEAEAQAQAICMQTEDFRAPTRRSWRKRKPEFEGN